MSLVSMQNGTSIDAAVDGPDGASVYRQVEAAVGAGGKGTGQYRAYSQLLEDIIQRPDPLSGGEPHGSATTPGGHAEVDPSLAKLLTSLAETFSPAELQMLVDNRQRLIVRSLDEDLSADESRRLAYLEWQLDQIEMAKGMPALRSLGQFVGQLRSLSTALTDSLGKLRERK